MKYIKNTNNKVWKKKSRDKLSLLGIFLLLIVISSCSDTTVVPDSSQESVISYIDGKPVVPISAAEYYDGRSSYLNDLKDRLSKNGRTVIEAMNNQIIRKNSKLLDDGTDAVIVGLSELRTTTSYKDKSASSNLLDDISSHIRVIDETGEAEEFELILEPHGNSGERVSSGALLSSGSTWLALNPDQFYVQEDRDGNEIWPVTFPAVSLDNPDREIEVTLDREGTLTWPAAAKGQSKSQHVANEMIYMNNLAITDPCISLDTGECIDPGGGGGPGPGDVNPPDRFVTSEIKTASFLALKTVRLDGTGDGDAASELQMHVEPYISYNYKFNREWNYVFDHKWGMSNRPLWFDDFSLLGVLEAGYRLYTDLTGELQSSAESIFSGRNTRTFAGDSRIYQTPDVNYKNRDYHFTNMRTWTYLDMPNFESGYSEGSRLDYFPIVPLGSFKWRVLMMDNDSKYPYANMRQRNTLGHNVWTFNMGTGQYQNIYTTVDGRRTESGKSDDLMWHSGISNVTLNSVNQQLVNRSEIRTLSPAGFKYVLKKINRTAEFRPVD